MHDPYKIQQEMRSLTRREMLAAQGWPVVALSAADHAKSHVPLDEWSHASLIKLAGSAMCGPCVGTVIWWIAQHGFSSLRPRGMRSCHIGALENSLGRRVCKITTGFGRPSILMSADLTGLRMLHLLASDSYLALLDRMFGTKKTPP